MRPSRLTPLLLPALLLSACEGLLGNQGSAEPPLITALSRELTTSEVAVIDASNRFGGELFAVLSRAEPGENLFISPLSASMALGMTMNGAAGTTFDEMRATLGFPEAMTALEINRSYRDLIALLRGTDRRVDFRIANAIWYRDTFGPAIAPSFLSEARDYFDARADGLDFGAPSAITTINGWAKEATNGKIEKVLESIDPAHVMFLANAIYFKGDWREAFERSETRLAPFSPRSGAPRDVPMMHRDGYARAAVVDGRIIADLGYGGDAFSMTVVLPRPDEDVNAMIDSLDSGFWHALPTLQVRQVSISLPKFTLRWEAKLNEPLKTMGMQAAFVNGGADFTRLSPTLGNQLFVSYVLQKTFVDVHEVGTEAAAVTVLAVGVTSAPSVLEIRVDRPFVFLLRERLSGTVLFMGKIVSP
jgi:serpin B